jgi:hypothetical protein
MAGSTLTISPRVHETGEIVRYEFDLSYSGSSRSQTLLYEFPRELAPPPPDNFDAALCATVLPAMAEGRDIRLRGPATSALLLNLSEFQLAWSRWLPAVYRPVEIEADSVVHSERPRTTRAIAAFSGGVDSSFTLLCNTVEAAAASYPLDTVLLVHGFDVSRSNPDAFRELMARTDTLRQLAGVQLRIVRTNSKELRFQPWQYCFGAELAACMHLFSGEFSHALIGSSEPYDALVLPWGSNPVTDHLLSGGRLAMVHDGAAFSRTDKIAFLSRFPEAMRSLKVCWQGSQQGRNCGVCEKCVRTQLNFLAVGIANAPCFDGPLDRRRIGGIPISSDAVLGELRSIVQYAEQHSIDEEWLRELRARLGRGKKNWTLRRQVRTSLARAGLLETVRRLQRQFAARPTMRTS